MKGVKREMTNKSSDRGHRPATNGYRPPNEQQIGYQPPTENKSRPQGTPPKKP